MLSFLYLEKKKRGGEIMFFYNKNHYFNEKRQKFSIRKYKVGTFSVVVGALFYLNGISNMVQATEMSDNPTATSVEEKQLGEVRKDTESKPVEDAQGVNTVVNQSTVEEKKEVAEKRNDSETTAKEEPVVVENSISIDKTETVASESTLSNVVSNEKEESLKSIKESAETSSLVQELQQVFQEGKSLSNTIHVDFRVELEEILKEIEENDKTQKNITKELIEQYKERIQNLKNKNDEYQKGLNEKVNKIEALQEEINSISSSIEYALEPEEKALLKVAGEFSVLRHTEVEANGFITQLKQLRNKVANRMTRAHSGKRDPRNGKPIDGKGESGFRGITYTHKENRRDGKLIENGSTAVYYNSDEIWSLIEIKGERVGNERKFTTYARGKVVEDVTPYYIVTVGFTENSPIKGLKMYVAYWDKSAGVQRSREIEYGRTEINNPITNAAIRGVVGQGGIVQPGRYEVHIASNTRVAPNQLKPYTFTFIIKPQSERNTVKDLSQTYVDDVRHLTETEKTALIEKFKAEHPDIMTPSGHKSDFERAEISADGTTMTIHFKDGFNPKTIQTNATNDIEAKYSSLTAYFGDSKELYTNPRELVRSKTGHEVPATAQVTYKTPFNLQQVGTRNVVVTTTYQNGVTKDVTTPYTVLDFIGKQDKKIYQNQSGQLGDARNYVTVSNNSAVPGELTVRWKGGSSTVDTSTAGVQHKEIEILRGNHLMKTVNIPVAIVDNINPTITAPDSVLLTRAEGLPSNISIDAQDNARGIGLKDANPIVVENLANPLRYNPSTKQIELSGVVPNNFQKTQATIKAVDKNGNTATKTITFNVQAQTDKYNAVANPQKQTVSYLATPSAEASVSTTGLPTGTRYTWKTTPNTSSPGDKTGVVEVTYPDTSKDTVNVTVSVRKLSDEYVPTGTKIVRNQNVPVTNNDLKSAVTINNNGNSKVKSVTASSISTVNAGTQTIRATVTYLDDTTDPVDIPLEVKDVTAPTIQTPSDRQNWDLIALDRTVPSITVTSVDNNGGTDIKSTTVTGLPDFLVYDNATKTIKFKNGVQEVTKLPIGQDSKIYNANIQVTDNANNSSQRQVTITVKSMTTKYNATPSGQKQTVSYGDTPDAGTSINKNGLPTGTTFTWATTPSTITGPGDKAGVVTVTYPDGSKDTVNVTVNVRALNAEYEPTVTKIIKNQKDLITNDELKAAVTISNNGNSKVKSVTPVGTISTAEFGNKTINATVTYLDDTTDSVTIPLEVNDKTAPTITTPTENQLWEVTSLDKTFPSIKIAVADNPGGSGIKSISPINLPSFLKYDKATSSIVFQDGVHEVPKLSRISRTTRNVTFIVEDNAGNRSERNIQIRQISMAEKYNPQANTTVQEVSYGETPNPKTSVNTVDLPRDTRYAWNSTPDTSKSGDKTSVVTVTYPDDSVDEVTVTVKVRKLSDEYDVSGAQIEVNQNTPVTNDDLKAKVTATSKVGNVSGTDKISKVTASPIDTSAYGNQNISATVTLKDGTTKDVTIPLKVKDVTKPTIQAPTENTNWEVTALDKVLPNMEVRAEDNANGSGIKTVGVTGLPDYLEYDSATHSIKFKSGKQEVERLPENTPSKEFILNIRAEDNVGNVSDRAVKITVSSMSTKKNPTPIPQNTNYGQLPDPNASVDKAGLPEGTNATWKIPPVITSPGTSTGVVEVTYPDGSKNTVDVTVNVSKLSDEYDVSATEIEVNQNDPVSNDELKAKVTATSKVGNVNGTDKISMVTASKINTVNYGSQNINATVTFKDGTTKEVTIPLTVKDVTKPTIQAPTNGQNWDLIAVEGEDPNIAVISEDNTGGSGVKSTTVTGLPDFLAYDEVTKTIKFKAGVTQVPSLPEGTDVQPHSITIEVEDNAGNKTSTPVTITVKSMTTKYDATPNSEKQTVSYGVTPDAATSVNTSGLPEGTSYAWKTTPDTNIPGEKDGVVEVTYKDGSKDTVNVKVTVKELSSEYEVTGSLIEVNQNTPVTNDDLKAKVTATSKVGNVSGTDKISTVVSKSPINTANYGDQTISATVTFKDGTTKDVIIPLKVKDVTNPTIQAPTNGQNWDLIAVEGQDPNIAVTSEDNAGGSGVKSTIVTNLPGFLAYDEATKTIKFKTGVTQVPGLPEGTDVQPHSITIEVEDNAGNKTSTPVTITVKSMTTKYDATPNSEKQTVSYGATPDAGTSVNTSGLPEGTSYAWKTTPVTTTPGEKDGVVEVTYKDGSKDTVNVKVNVNKLSDEYNVTGAPIEVNQNTPVTNDDLKAKVTATSKEGNVSGTDKIAKVEPKAQVSTAAYGETNIEATVTFKDGTTKDVTIPLKVKDVTKPTIQAPTNGQNWDLIAVEGQDPNIAVTSEDNTGGSGVKTTTVTGLPDFLAYDEATKTIKFKTGVTQVPSLPEGTDVQAHNVTITVTDNAGNEATTNVTITVKSMTTKYDATPNSEKQTVSYGATPDAATSVNTSGLPEGTKYKWTTTPDTNIPGEKDGVVEVTYKDGSKDTVNVKVTVKELSSEYEVTGSLIEVNQNTPVTNDDLKAKVTATSKVGNVSGTDKISTVVPKSPINTANYGEQNISATVTFKDGTTKEVTIPLNVKDVTPPTITTPKENTNWEMTALDKTLPNMEVSSEDNANGSGIKNVTVIGLPDYLEYDSVTNVIKFKAGKQTVEKLPENIPNKEFTLNIRVEDNAGNFSERSAKITVSSMSAKNTPTAKQPNQTAKHGSDPRAEGSINTDGLPSGTTYTWVEKPDTNTTPGSKTGKVLITYPDKSTEEVTVTVEVTPQKDDYDPQPKAQTVDNGTVPNAEDSVDKTGLPEGTRVTWKETPVVNTPGSHPTVALVTYPDGTIDEVTVPITVKEQKDTFTPTAKQPAPTAKHGSDPSAEGSINTDGLPSGTTYTWVEKPDTNTTPGSKTGKVLITYPDKSTEEVTVTVEVTPQKDDYDPQPKAQTVDNGTVPNAEDSVDKTGLPEGTRVTWKETPVVNTPGSHPTVALVTYPDGTIDEVTVPITVKEQKDTFTPTAKQPAPTAKHGSDPSAEGSINTDGLPKGTTYTWVEKPDTNTTPGIKSGKVLITYPDKSTEEVTVTVEVTPQNADYDPQPKAQTVDNGTVPNAEDSVDKAGLPTGTTVTWKTPPVVNTPGSHPGVALVTYPDGTVDEVTVPITVKEQKDTFTPTAKQPAPTAKHGSDPSAEGSINTDGLPKGTTYTWVEKPDTNTTPGIKSGKVLITYPDKSTKEVSVTVEVTPQNADYDPQPKAQTVDNGTVPNAEDSVNKTGLPEGTRVTWKETPVVNTPGSHPTATLVTYPDGTIDEVTVPITVKEQKDTFTPTAKQPAPTAKHGSDPSAEGSINTDGLPKGTTYTWVEKPDTNTTPGSKTGKVLITYPDKSTEEVTVTVEVTPQKDDYNPQPKAQTVDNGTVPNAEDSVDKTGLPSGTTVTWKTNPDVSTPGAHPTVALVTYPDGTVDEVTVPITVKEQKDTFNPTAKQPAPTAKHGSAPSAEGSINTDGLPSGTTYTWVEKPDTNTTPGSKTGKVLITYPDKSTEEVTVTVEVTPQKDDYDPQPKAQTADNGTVPNAEDSVDKTGLPDGTTVTWKTTPDVSTPGSHPTVALVTYPDGTIDEVTVPITVKEQKDTFNPTAKQPAPTAKHGSEPSAEGSINTDGLPKGTTYTWVEKPDTNTTPGSKTGKVLITYPDKSTEEVTVTVEVTPQKDDYDPQPKAQTVDNGTVPNAEDSVDKTGLPEGTRVTWKTPLVVNTPGSHPTVALVTYPDGTIDEVPVPITVKEQKDTFTPIAKQPAPTAKHGSDPSAEGSINTDGLPKGTTYTWVEKPDTNTTPGIKSGKVLITYPDKSTKEVSVTVEVTPQKDDYDPQPTTPNQEVSYKGTPSAETSVNKNGLPANTTYSWETPVDTDIPGEKTGVVIVHYPDGTEDKVKVTVKVKDTDAKGVPEVQSEVPEFNGGVNGDPEVQPEVPEFNGGVNGDPEVQPEIPEFNGGVKGDPEVQAELPEFNGGVNGDPEVQPEVPEFNGGVNGDPEVQPEVPEFNGGVNGDPEVQPEVPEFNGGVNGELPASVVESPKDKLIITKWVDEQDNQLKPADAKTPAVLGEANEALEAGEIEGYVFVRTETKGDIVTHIFRKVTPDKSESSGEQQGGNNKSQPILEAPTDYTDCKPEAINPSEQPSETENTAMKTKTSQTILPNTGTSDSFGMFSTAVASILAGLAFILPVKKKDEE